MFERERHELGQDEGLLRQAEEVRIGQLGEVVEIDGLVLDRLLDLAREAVEQRRDKFSEQILDLPDET